MLKIKHTKSTSALFVILISVCFAAVPNLVFASSGSINLLDTYPEDGATYEVVDYFMYQISAVNSNTTVFVSIDDGPQIQMTYQGITNKTGINDSANTWHTWQIKVPAITTSGTHRFQFFSQYYVWQNMDQYWAEYNAYTTAKSFTIKNSTPTPTEPTPPTTTSQTNPIAIITLTILLLTVISLLVYYSTILISKRHMYT